MTASGSSTRTAGSSDAAIVSRLLRAKLIDVWPGDGGLEYRLTALGVRVRSILSPLDRMPIPLRLVASVEWRRRNGGNCRAHAFVDGKPLCNAGAKVKGMVAIVGPVYGAKCVWCVSAVRSK